LWSIPQVLLLLALGGRLTRCTRRILLLAGSTLVTLARSTLATWATHAASTLAAGATHAATILATAPAHAGTTHPVKAARPSKPTIPGSEKATEATIRAAAPEAFVETFEQPVGLLPTHVTIRYRLLDGCLHLLVAGALHCILDCLQLHTGTVGKVGQVAAAPHLGSHLFNSESEHAGCRLHAFLATAGARSGASILTRLGVGRGRRGVLSQSRTRHEQHSDHTDYQQSAQRVFEIPIHVRLLSVFVVGSADQDAGHPGLF
jgi:hypothetical protein